MSNAAKDFDILAINLNLHNFDNLIKFLDIYLAKFLDTSTNSFSSVFVKLLSNLNRS